MNTFSKLRAKHQKFVYESYSYAYHTNAIEIEFHYLLEPDIRFTPKIRIERVSKREYDRTPKTLLSNAVFHLGMIELLSYWKLSCAQSVEIIPHALTKPQRTFWHKVIRKGMGQFFFENNISWKDDMLSFQFANRDTLAPRTYPCSKYILVPVGGGKDSAVSLELLAKEKSRITSLALNPTTPIRKTVRAFSPHRHIEVQRTIDPLLFSLNEKGYLNGHTPFSAYLAFLSFLIAIITKHSYVALSNERSANEGNITFEGQDVNHQWSKTFEFERMFRSYTKTYICPSVEYFSLLRPLYEIQITKLFARYPAYHKKIVSCNVAFTRRSRKRTWCGNCAKCLFVYASLFPFLSKERIQSIFGSDLFENKSLKPELEELIGKRVCKPFECVGTRKESIASFMLCINAYKKRGEALPFLLAHFLRIRKDSRTSVSPKRILASWNRQHTIPPVFEKKVKQAWKLHLHE